MSVISRGPVFRWCDPGQILIIEKSTRDSRVYGLVAAILRREQRPDAERALREVAELCDCHPPKSELVLEWKEERPQARRHICEEHLRHRGGRHL